MTPELDCKEVSRLISEGLTASLPADERERLRQHFAHLPDLPHCR